MVECGALEFQEADMVKALEFGHAAIKTLVKLQKELQAKVGKHQAGSRRSPSATRRSTSWWPPSTPRSCWPPSP